MGVHIQRRLQVRVPEQGLSGLESFAADGKYIAYLLDCPVRKTRSMWWYGFPKRQYGRRFHLEASTEAYQLGCQLFPVVCVTR